MTELLAHSPYGPSSAERWINCPGSVAATKGLPDTTSRCAAEGTAAHTLSEWCRRENRLAAFYLGRELSVDGYEFVVNQEMVDGVQEFVDVCEDVDGDPFYEVRVHYDELVEGGFGTSDDIRIRDGYCCVTDLKYGKGIQVFAEKNAQLMLYAYGTYLEFRHLYDFDVFELRVSQPRLNHFDTWEISLADLLKWVEEVARPALCKTSFAAGDHCTFCKLKLTCAVRGTWALKQVTGSTSDFDDLDDLADRTASQGGALAAEMSVSTLDKCLAAVDAVVAWAKDMKAHAMRELQQGHVVGDWKLVAGRSRRHYTAAEDEVVDHLEREGLRDEQIWKRKLVTPPQLEKIIGKKHVLMTDPDKGEGGIVRKGPGKPKLAPGSDKRPAMSVDALQEFNDLGNEDDAEDDE